MEQFKILYDPEKENEIISKLTDVYKNGDYEIVVGYSGGKDSSLVAELILKMIKRIGYKNPIHFIFTDTGIELPQLIEHVKNYFNHVKNNFPEVNLHILNPQYEESFWYKTIIQGYTAPRWNFRWCTDRLKIKPYKKFVQSIKRPVLLLLGSRSAESSSRKRTVEKYTQDFVCKISKNRYSCCPIKDLATEEVWAYLLHGAPLSGYDYKTLYYLYKDSKECAFQVDAKSSSCGGSRFGCYVCTLVKNDKTTESLAQKDERLFLFLLLREKLIDYSKDKDENGRMFLENRKLLLLELEKIERLTGLIGSEYLQKIKQDFESINAANN